MMFSKVLVILSGDESFLRLDFKTALKKYRYAIAVGHETNADIRLIAM
jgi:hypothetical protein